MFLYFIQQSEIFLWKIFVIDSILLLTVVRVTRGQLAHEIEMGNDPKFSGSQLDIGQATEILVADNSWTSVITAFGSPRNWQSNGTV